MNNNQTKFVLPIEFGKDDSNNVIVKDLTELPHLLIYGKTGTGKTAFARSFLTSITNNLPYTEYKLMIFDPKTVEYKQFNKFQHLLCPVITDANESFKKFDLILQMIDERYQKLFDNKTTNIKEYHEKISKDDMPYIVITIDELADYLAVDKEKTEELIQNVCSKGRGVGIHMMIATQKANLSNLPDTIKDFLPVKIYFNQDNPKEPVLIIEELGCKPVSVHRLHDKK